MLHDAGTLAFDVYAHMQYLDCGLTTYGSAVLIQGIETPPPAQGQRWEGDDLAASIGPESGDQRASRAINKLAHDPSVNLREAAEQGRTAALRDQLVGLEENKDPAFPMRGFLLPARPRR